MDPFTLEVILIGGLGLISGFMGTVGGGAGLALLPGLLWICPDPLQAIAINKVSTYLGTFMVGAGRFAQARRVRAGYYLPLAISYGAGATTGVLLLQHVLDRQSIYPLAGLAILLLAGLTLVRDRIHRLLDKVAGHGQLHVLIRHSVGFAVGVYSGGLPGSGVMLIAVAVLLYNANHREAVANKPYIQLVGMLVPSILYLSSGDIPFMLAATATGGAILGTSLGASYVLAVRLPWLRTIYVGISVLGVIVMMFRYFGMIG